MIDCTINGTTIETCPGGLMTGSEVLEWARDEGVGIPEGHILLYRCKNGTDRIIGKDDKVAVCDADTFYTMDPGDNA